MERKLLFLLVAVALPACTSNGPDAAQRALVEVRLSNWPRAMQEIEKLRRQDPDNPRILALHEKIKKGYQLDRARTLVFEDHEAEALVILGLLLDSHPDFEEARLWKDKARSKLSQTRVDEARALMGGGHSEEAARKLIEAIELAPASESAIKANKNLQAYIQRRLDIAKQRYGNAIGARTLPDWLRVWRDTSISLDKDPQHADAKRRQHEAQRRLAEKERDNAYDLQSREYWAAAARAWRHAEELAKGSELDWSEEAIRMAAQCDKEQQVDQLLTKAKLRIEGKRFADASKILDEVKELTVHNIPRLSVVQLELKQAEEQALFEEATLLKLDERYPESLEKFRELNERDPYGEAADYIEQLLDILTSAEELFEEAQALEKSGELIQAEAKYRDLESIYWRHPGLKGRKRYKATPMPTNKKAPKKSGFPKSEAPKSERSKSEPPKPPV